MIEWVRASQLARHWGKSYAAVYNATKRGKIEPNARGLYDLEASLKILRSGRQAPPPQGSVSGVNHLNGEKWSDEERPAIVERSSPEEAALDTVKLALTDPKEFMRSTGIPESRRVTEAAAALKALAELERASTAWVRVEDAIAIFENKLSHVRQRILTVPGAIASLVSPQDPAHGETVIAEALNEALADLSGEAVAEEAQKMRTARMDRVAMKRASKTA